MLRRTLGEQVVVELHPGPALWPVKVDPAQLDEAISQPRDQRARRHAQRRHRRHRDPTMSGSTATMPPPIADATPGEYVQVAVSDTGAGMESGA
jgi:hypothetical protein